MMDMARSHEAAHDEAIAALRLDRSGQIVDATIEAASMLGFGAGDLHGLTLSDLAAEQWREMAGDATARILLGDTRMFQLMLRGKSGRRTLVQMASTSGRATAHQILEHLRLAGQKKIGLLMFQQSAGFAVEKEILLSPSGSLEEAAAGLFRAMRLLDQSDLDVIIAEQFPNTGIGRAINDRLERASYTG